QGGAGGGAAGLAGSATIRSARRSPPRSPLNFAMPISAPFGDGFGPRGDAMHTGLDFPAPSGTSVLAAGLVCVSSTGYDPGGEVTLVVIEHRAGMTSWYAHLSRISVPPGRCLVA